MRIAILGPGGIAAKHAVAATALGHELVGVVGRTHSHAAAFAAQHGGATFSDLDAMIDAVAPELLIVALPPFAHAGEVEHAASRGLHLLVEKPLALTTQAADRMFAAAETAGVVAANGFMYRFGDAVRAWREADTGPIGLYTGSYHCNALHAPWWRDRTKSGGQLVEQVIHQIDLIRHFVGEPDTVYARRANLFHRDVPGYTAEDVGTVMFGWDDGRIATLTHSNIATPGQWQKAWQLHAERLTGHFAGWNDAVLTPTVAGSAPRVVTGTTDVFQAQLADVVAAIEQKRPPRRHARGRREEPRPRASRRPIGGRGQGGAADVRKSRRRHKYQTTPAKAGAQLLRVLRRRSDLDHENLSNWAPASAGVVKSGLTSG